MGQRGHRQVCLRTDQAHVPRALLPPRCGSRVPLGYVSVPESTQQSLVRDVDALVSAVLAEAPLTEIIPIVDRIKVSVDQWGEIPAGTIAELRSAIDLMWGGRACATISALLLARSGLNVPPGGAGTS